ncbi:hypothetical protein SGPA1_40865 [Streptomyces misionensis JCM 4497]
MGAGSRLHRGRSGADRRTGGRSGPLGQRVAGAGLARCARHGRPDAAHGPQQGQGRIRRPADRTGPPHRGGRLPGRRHPALAGRARARRGGPVPAGPRIGTGRDRLARRGRRGRRGARHRDSRWSAAGPAGRGGTGGDLRPVRPDLRHGPAGVQRPHPRGPRMAADAPQPPRGPGEHPALRPPPLSPWQSRTVGQGDTLNSAPEPCTAQRWPGAEYGCASARPHWGESADISTGHRN